MTIDHFAMLAFVLLLTASPEPSAAWWFAGAWCVSRLLQWVLLGAVIEAKRQRKGLTLFTIDEQELDRRLQPERKDS
jgi:hypothetical protein